MRITSFALWASILAGACAPPAPPARPAPSAPAGADPAFVVRPPEPGERFFAGLRQLTFGGQNAEAYFSADGTRLIFQRQENDSTCDQQYVINVDGTGLRRISNGLGRTTCGYFYDHDRRVLYSSTFEHDRACPPRPDFSKGYVWALYDYDIYTAAVDGSDLIRLTRTPGYDAEATLSPDGRRVVFTSMRDGDLDIYTMNLDGSDVRRLTTTLGYDGGPFFSPDGSQIVYRAWHPETPEEIADYRALLAQGLVRPSRMELWVMNADGSGQRQVTHLGGANFAPYFHPDGKRIIFASNYRDPRSRNFDLYLINLDGSGLEPVTTSTEFDGFPMFSPDGKLLVFASNRFGSVPGETNIFVADWVEPGKEARQP
jgi:Tol biopolymer transport system component